MSTFDSEKWQKWFSEGEDNKPPSYPRQSKQTSPSLSSYRPVQIIGIILILFIVLGILKGIYSEWLWFSSLDYGSVYTTILKTKVSLFFAGAAIFAALFLGNLSLAARLSTESKSSIWPWSRARNKEQTKKSIVIGTALLSLIFGSIAQGNWQTVLQFFNQQPFAALDPIFHQDVSFYVFSLPFLQTLRGWFTGALIVCLIGIIITYLLGHDLKSFKIENLAKPVLVHIGGLALVILGLFAWGYRLGVWELVFSTRGVVFGASYTDIHAQLPAQWILVAVVLVCMGVFVPAMLKHKPRWFLYGIGAWVAVAIVCGAIFPALMQRFQVQPNELVKETPYIEYNIQATREAFGLSHIEEEFFPAEEMPSYQDIVQNKTTIDNIRLWDHRPLKDTYNQIQSIRLYYYFHDVDVDRYTINGEYQQVMLAARELSAEKLSSEAQTWVNRKLQFTHGYGLAMSPVNKITSEGLPELLIKDIPPVGELRVEQPQIYFGEETGDYVIVNTKTQEFDYPLGEENVYSHYQGEGGVNLDSFFRRLIYAWQFGDFNILISGELSAESKILYYRNIAERVNHLAPFLELDSDPYLVVMDGKLYWIQDAYTTSERYPYSEPIYGGVNYIRNSVKAVVDAYNGDVTFYVTDPEDALIQTYQSIFPTLFTSAEQMPEDLKAHLRYPEDMFDIQAMVYQSYHMQDVRVFYNREDLWAVPREVYAGSEQVMEPYYIIMRLPDAEKEEFLLMLPFTPANKNNTIGWLAARCDGENYGKLLAYHFPKDKLIYGPSQIENRIQQDTVITEQLALWGRGGSRVIRGNLLMIPMGKSNLYVEPVFLQAEAGGLPELKRVIVVSGNQIAMEATLGESLAAIYDNEALLPPTTEIPPSPGTGDIVNDTVASLIAEAQQHYALALQYQMAGDWAGYGEELDALETILDRLESLTAVE